MKPITLLFLAVVLCLGCNPSIKDKDAKTVVEKGTDFDSLPKQKDINDDASTGHHDSDYSIDAYDTDSDTNTGTATSINAPNTFWVGFFNPHREVNMDDKYIAADGLFWERSNKISISIDSIIGDSIIGHSVVAGNDRPFYGTVDADGVYHVKEPGDDKYDGVFTFEIKDGRLVGEWTAYKSIDIPKRSYELEKKVYQYNPDIMLEYGQYGNWNKYIEKEEQIEVDKGTPDAEVHKWIQKEYAASTQKIYEINASNTLLKKEDVENLTNSDLIVIRNTIYARHGYSFKNRPLRVFFDRQDWYIPVHADIRSAFTTIEKQNIQLLLRYEKNAKEYYDYFGRG